MLYKTTKTTTNLSENAKIGAKYRSCRKRTMLSTIRKIVMPKLKNTTSLQKELELYKMSKAPKTFSVNNPPATQSPEGAKNNPPVGKHKKPHFELHRTLCNFPGCNGIVCLKLCGKEIERKSIAHATHGKSPENEPDKKTVEVSQTDFDGNQKPQKLVFYRKPHNTPKTPEEPTYTQRVKTDKNMQDEIEKHEDKI